MGDHINTIQKKKYIKYFMGTESHNTIMLDNLDQMLKGERDLFGITGRKH